MDAASTSLPLATLLTARVPTSLWIELTSVCPFDCVFCSRRMRRGNGEHMPFELYERIIGQLDRPSVIRLNYSGESLHYPRLRDAILLAKRTGAQVELVTALSSGSKDQVRSLVDSGLDRLTVSLHALDPALYQRIYRFSSAAKLHDAFTLLQERKADGPQIDLSFVALEENIGELPRLAEFAAGAGISSIAVHPVIRRDLIPITFEAELEDGHRLRPQFLARVEQAAASARETAPGVAVEIARPAEVERVAGHAGIATCEQNPWETIHILANGDAVVCEVQDHVSLGSLAAHSLSDVWHGPAYSEFRARYSENREATCHTCVWYRFAPDSSNDPQWVRGWHPFDKGDTVHWSHATAAIWVPTSALEPRVGMSGVLPPASIDDPLRVTIFADDYPMGEVLNKTSESRSFDFSAYVPVVQNHDPRGVLFSFECSRTYSPREAGGSDIRQLGFGLRSLEINPPSAKRASNRLKQALAIPLLRTAGRVPRSRTATRTGMSPGLTIVIPESGTPEILDLCLEALKSALTSVTEPWEAIVWVNGASPSLYASLRERHPQVEFAFHPKRQGFSTAVASALQRVRHEWTYLLNSDASVDAQALVEVLRLRAASRFAIASQIEAYDDQHRRIESNWTRLAVENGLVQLWDAYPPPKDPLEMPYAGGTAALYQTALLAQFAKDTAVYDPFYWEDVEWGASAANAGLACLLAPASRVRHLRRATVNRLYAPAEVERIFERNRLLFQLRSHGPLGEPAALREAIGQGSWRTLWELYRRWPSILRARSYRNI